MRSLLVLFASLVAGLVGLSSLAVPVSLAGTPPTLNRAEASTYRVDPGHSVVLFRTRHLKVSYFHGRFNQVTGEITYDAASPEDSSIRIVVDAKSVDTNSGDRDQHLMSPDFFSAEEFPEIIFESKQVVAKGDTLHVTGDFTLHGTTREITIEATKVGEGDTPFQDFRVGFETVFNIDPKEYGIQYMQNSDMLGPNVRITLAIECVREE